MSDNATLIRVCGKVQGVGFRPLVWQLAQRLHLSGDVSNDGAGVIVRLAGNADDFVAALYRECPPLAKIERLTRTRFHWPRLPDGFTIRQSGGGAMTTRIVPDAATCPACLRELNDPRDRRYRYPFINCTHCGPRFTIIRAMPYDRPNTVMAAFPLCPACEAEYRAPADRRFHAQPVACPECGPQLAWIAGHERAEREAALQAAISALRQGRIVAIKGLGGFHLACDATLDAPVARLRARKRRPGKPLAVMLPSAAGLPPDVTAHLSSPAAPIVVIDKAWLPGLSSAIAPGLNEVGVMLPSNPVQHLLLQGMGRPLVMTSGNRNGQPPALTNERAQTALADIADGYLLHNRAILQRMDDSVLRADGEMLRRARGYVPDALPLPPGFPLAQPALCLGADLKNTFALLRDDSVVLSQHFGDLAQPGVEEQWRRALSLMGEIYDFTPRHIVVDAHPGYRSTALGSTFGLPIEPVLHHHAHAAACLAEHGWPLSNGPVIALTLDGIGYGAGGQLWGGECLRVDYRRCERLGGLPAVALPGGDLAAQEPWRNLLAQFLAFVPGWQQYPESATVLAHGWQPLARAVTRGINSPCASSAGRLFDAVACALGCVAPRQSYEGEAACRLEALALQATCDFHPVTLPLAGETLDMATFWRQWLAWQAPASDRAFAFHDALAGGLAALVRRYAGNGDTVACGGGVFHNRLLRARLAARLPEMNLWFPHLLPAGDGGIAFGQAVVAAARLHDHRIMS